MKYFNTTGTCRPSDHYMVDISERLDIVIDYLGKQYIVELKQSGLLPPVNIKGRTLIEAIV